MIHESEISKWYETLDEARQDGFAPVKCTSLLQFYKLKGRVSTIAKENYEPIVYVQYVYFSPNENRYYIKTFGNYLFDDFYFFRPLLDLGQNALIERLRERILHGHGIWILFNKQQIGDTSQMLTRIWNANRSDKGKLQYKDYLALAELSLKLQDFQENQKDVTGFKTACKIMKDKISDMWKTFQPNTK